MTDSCVLVNNYKELESRLCNSEEIFQKHRGRDLTSGTPIKNPIFSESVECLRSDTKGILDRISFILEDMEDSEREKAISFLKNWLIMGNLDVVTNALGYSKLNLSKKASNLQKIEKKYT